MLHKSKIFLVLSLFLITCASAQPTQDISAQPVHPEMQPIHSPEFSDPSKPIVADENSATFIVRLKSNPTTGYTWFIKQINPQILKIDAHRYVPPQRQIPGAGGYEEWAFRVKPNAFKAAPISTTIQMFYARPWEKREGKPITFTVRVKKVNQ
jgi:predicted secreted protein